MCKELMSQKLSATTCAVQSAVLALPRVPWTQLWTRCLTFVTAGAASLPRTVRPAAARAGTRMRGILVEQNLLRILPVGAVLLALIVAAPTLWSGWSDDDALHRTALLSSSLPAAMSRLYVFLDPATNMARMDAGVLPWWALETSKVAFWRPLAALSLWLDYRLWPDTNLLMHLHNALWYAVACAIAASAYLRFCGGARSAGLAALLFTLSVTHVDCVAPLSSRNILMGASFGLLTLLLHDRWRSQGQGAARLLAPVSLALGLLCSEAVVAVAAYLCAYAICLDRAPRRKRLASLVPYGGVMLAWLLAYRWMGYGAYGSAFYVDPLREPVSFLRAAAENVPVLLFGQWIAPDPAVYAVLAPAAKRVLWSLALLSAGFLVWLWLPLLQREARARFMLVGMAIALLPLCAVGLPSGRHLMFVSFGALGLLAQLVVDELRHRPKDRARVRGSRAARVWTFVLLALHGFLYPVIVPLARQTVDTLSTTIADIGAAAGEELRTAVVINMPSPGQLIYVPALSQLDGQPAPAQLRALAPGYFAVSVERLDPFTLAVRPEHGYLLRPGSLLRTARDWLPVGHPSYAMQYGDGLFRSPTVPIAAGQVTELSGMRVEVTQLTEDGRPLEATVRFDVPLDDSSLLWLQWDWKQGAYLPFVPPQTGERALIAGPA